MPYDKLFMFIQWPQDPKIAGPMYGSAITFSWRVKQAVWNHFDLLHIVCLCTDKGV
jgi:hypothetical protein